jgi:hypothetical protein
VRYLFKSQTLSLQNFSSIFHHQQIEDPAKKQHNPTSLHDLIYSEWNSLHKTDRILKHDLNIRTKNFLALGKLLVRN